MTTSIFNIDITVINDIQHHSILQISLPSSRKERMLTMVYIDHVLLYDNRYFDHVHLYDNQYFDEAK